MMRTSILSVVFSALIACSLAAPVLDRRARQTSASDLLNNVRTGMSVLSKHWRYRLSQSLSVSYSCLDSDGGNCGVLRSALGVTCRLYEANTILPKINLPNPTDQDVLQIMSEKSLADSCTWVNETLTNIAGSSGLPSGVQCSNVSSLAGVCSQWSDSVAIMRIESKVDRLNPMILNETTWLNDKKINATALFLDCPGPSCILD